MIFERRFLVVLAVSFGVLMAGCKAKTGPAGPSGKDGADSSNVYTASFQTGVEPSSSYSGITWNRIDSANQATAYPNDGALLLSSSTTAERSAFLVRFDVGGLIPSNATLTTAAIELVSSSSTSLTASVTVGAHEVVSNYNWTYQVTWAYQNGVAVRAFDSSCYGSTLGTCVIPSSYSGGTYRVGIPIPTSTVRDWMNGSNNGIAIISENMGHDSTGQAVFSTPSDSNLNFRPILMVNYTL